MKNEYMHRKCCSRWVQCCFTSTETRRTLRHREPRMATSNFTQLLSSKKSVKGESVHWFLSGSPSATLQVFYYLALRWLQPLRDVSLQIVWHCLLIFQFSFNYLALHWLQPLQDVSLQIVWHFVLIFHAASFCWQEIFSGLSHRQSFLQKFASLSYSFGPDFMWNLHFICLSFVSCLACTSGSYRDGNLLLLEPTLSVQKKNGGL